MIREDQDLDGLVELRDSDVIELVPGQPVRPTPVEPASDRVDGVAVSVTGVGERRDTRPPPRRVPSAVGLARPIKERDRRASSVGKPPPPDRRSR